MFHSYIQGKPLVRKLGEKAERKWNTLQLDRSMWIVKKNVQNDGK